MILSATVCFLSGAVIGIKFNVKMLAHASILVLLVWAGIGTFGGSAIGSTLIGGVTSLITLQIGYFAAIVLAALGYLDQRPTEAVATDDRHVQADDRSTAPQRPI